jgi:cytochrome c-type biogenesis protein
MAPEVSFLAAFVAGVLSITSPCVLPLLPLYMAHLAGVATGPGATTPDRGRLMANAAAYVLGFSVVFIALGVALGAAGSLVSAASVVAGHRYWLVRLGGLFLIVLGLHQIGLFRLPMLDRERRLVETHPSGGAVTSSFVVGVTFGAGWSPCVGPILGAILTLAASQGDINRAAALLATYSLGLAIPFLTVAALGARSGILPKLGPRLAGLTSASGVVMLAIGLLMVLGIYQQFFARLVAASPWTPWEPAI